MRSFVAALLIVLAPVAARAEIERVDIIEYGLYSSEVDGYTPESRSALGRIGNVSAYRHLERTTTICAKLGVKFGVEYVVIGKPGGGTFKLEMVTQFPQGGVINGNGVKFERSQWDTPAMIGEHSHRNFSFDEPWELVSGEWVFEFHSEGRKVGEKRFKVLKDCSPLS